MTSSEGEQNLFDDVRGHSPALGPLHLEQVYHNAPVGLFALDLQYRFTQVNQSMSDITGLPVQELVGRELDHALPLLASGLRGILSPVIERAEPVTGIDLRVAPRDAADTARDYLCSYFPLRDAAGRVAGVVGAMAEVTARRHAEEALRTTATELVGILEGMSDAFFSMTHDLTVRYFNAAAERSLGISREQVVGRRFFDAFPETKGSIFEEHFRRVVQERVPVSFETYFDVAPYTNWYEVRAYPDPNGVSVLFQIISDRKRNEERHREDEERLEALLRLSQAQFRTSDEVCNFALEETVRLTQSEIGFVAFLSSDEAVLTMHAWSKTVMNQCALDKQRMVYDVETAGLLGEPVRQRRPVIVNRYEDPHPAKKGTPDGHVPLHRYLAVPVLDDGRIVLVAGVANKATDYSSSDARQVTLLMTEMAQLVRRKRLEEEQQRLEAKMLQTQKLESLGVLAGGIAHDFNNILMAILGHVDLVLAEASPVAPYRESLVEVERAARRAADLCRQMLAYSGKGKFQVQPIHLRELIEEMLHMLQVSISKKAVLKLNLAKPTPTVEGDPTQLRQIIMNLVVNASEAIGDCSGLITISTGQMICDDAYLSEVYLDGKLAEGLYAFIEVSDTGGGMDKNTVARIFEPFFTTKFTGRGLGLAAVLGIVRGHHGAIKVYSEPGAGTTFKLLFPAANSASHGLAAQEPEPQSDRNGLILLVDDEPAIRKVATAMLERLGYRVLTAANGREALAVFQERVHEIACVLLDLTMPHMDGEETFRELRRIRADVRVVLCSGYNEQDITGRFISKGLRGFIQKPYQMKALAQALQDATRD